MNDELNVPNERIRQRNDVFKAWLVDGAEFVGKYEFPRINTCSVTPSRAIPFEKAMKTTDKNQWVHFYIDDRRFECIWNNPKAYLDCLKKYQGIISPDFSLYRDMPLSMQIWNTYRNRAIAYWLQSNGVNVIPNIRWGDERTYEFCFDGTDKNSTVAVGTHGCIKRREDKHYFIMGIHEMVKRLSPKNIIVYGTALDNLFLPFKQRGITILQIESQFSMSRKQVTA